MFHCCDRFVFSLTKAEIKTEGKISTLRHAAVPVNSSTYNTLSVSQRLIGLSIGTVIWSGLVILVVQDIVIKAEQIDGNRVFASEVLLSSRQEGLGEVEAG